MSPAGRATETNESLSDADVRVPYLDLRPLHEPLKEEIMREISDLIDEGAFTNGRQVGEFEAAFASFCGTLHCVGMASGLDALRLALLAGGLEPGDEVLVPAQTFVATLEAVTQAGGVPVPVDVSNTDYAIDPQAVEAAVTPRSRSLVPVHLFGQMADLRTLLDVAARAGLWLLEDACQAHGAIRDGLRAGAGGRAAAFSFYPGKNLGAMGDAGALVTGDGDLAARARAAREHGQRRRHEHEMSGYTARMDTIQALVLRLKLPLLEGWNAQRRQAARRYEEALRDVGDLRLPRVPAGSDPVWHVYAIRTRDPVALADFLARRRIATARHYPLPPHLTPAFAQLGYREGAFPVAEALAREALSLPLHPSISADQQDEVAETIIDYFRRG